MLDFVLVLGHVPGTNIYITFYEFIALLAVSITIVYLWKRHPLLVRRWLLMIRLSTLVIFYLVVRQSQRFIGSLHPRLPA